MRTSAGQRKRGYQTQVFESFEPEFKDAPAAPRETRTSKKSIEQHLRPNIPVELPEYKSMKPRGDKMPLPVKRLTQPMVEYDFIKPKVIYRLQDPKVLENSARICCIDAFRIRQMDPIEITSRTANKRVPHQNPYVPQVSTSNKAKLTYRAGFQSYQPDSVPDRLDKYMICGRAESVYSPGVHPISVRKGGFQCMTRENYNRSIR